MAYEQALIAAGAEVLAFKGFGSYQGDWWARVKYQGKDGWVTGSYGSCSGCDAFQSEFGWDYSCGEDYHERGSRPECADCQESPKKMADFGRTYLDEKVLSQEQALKVATENVPWDSSAEEMVAFIKANAAPASAAA